MKKDLIKEVVRDFHREPLPDIIRRDLRLPLDSGKIVTLVGVRRSGKSFLLFDTIKRLLTEKGLHKEQILYMNFEDERLELAQDELQFILRGFQELYPDQNLSACYFFFDEVQNLQGWEKFLRRIYDTITRNIFITGSNAKLLSREIATALRGRTIPFEVYPLSFREYLRFKGIDIDIYHAKTRAKIFHSFENFLVEGGFPELVRFTEKSMKNRILQEYFNVMLYRDIIERFRFRNVVILKYLMKRIMESITTPLSVNKIYHELKSQGYRIGKNLLYEYVDAAEAVFLVFTVKKYSLSVLKRELSAQKVYIVDNGLLNAVTIKFSKDFGKLLENQVFLEFLKRGEDVFFFKNKRECDFLVAQNGTINKAIQVCYDVSEPDTLKREVEGLKYAMKEAGLKIGWILTMDEEKQVVEDGLVINIVPAYKYFLEN